MKIIRFYENRWIYFAISLTLFLVGIAMIFVNGVQLDIQFKGGAILKYNYVGDINEDRATDIAEEVTGRVVTTQITSDLATDEKRLVLNIAGNQGLDAKVQSELDDALKAEFPDAGLKLSESSMVEPFFGHRFLRNGIIAILLASFFVVVYVWIRFRRIGGLSAGLMALVALFHDLLVVFFTCVIFGIPIGDSFVAVALTIIGYSINDTIVIYDRIRENFKKYPRQPIEWVTNLSISQSMMRSVNTNLCVTLSVAIVYVLAFANSIESIQGFALPMAIGSISGCYSTICISGPLWVMWKKHKAAKK
ncbi:MAG TPA: protein translocase subunit SecF [Candidatus Atribacteria bacterium]|nr:protein translocase subunit SecF [Candidatus Atribacteria bacterium]HPT78809.1 protein translocase subunit SecF [Candidatus Atribacteria bacterium]